jgi:hypothetical protein
MLGRTLFRARGPRRQPLPPGRGGHQERLTARKCPPAIRPGYPAKTLKAKQHIKVLIVANKSPACSEKETASGSGFKTVDRMPTRILTAATRANNIALAARSVQASSEPSFQIRNRLVNEQRAVLRSNRARGPYRSGRSPSKVPEYPFVKNDGAWRVVEQEPCRRTLDRGAYPTYEPHAHPRNVRMPACA